MFAWLRFLLVRLRFRLWRAGAPLPPVSGWDKLVREVVSVPIWRKDGLMGAPLEWSLLRFEESRLVPYGSVCAWSGRAISGDTPITCGGVDLSAWGVRCARCGTPIHVDLAGMRNTFDVPSCPPCRSAVRRVMES